MINTTISIKGTISNIIQNNNNKIFAAFKSNDIPIQYRSKKFPDRIFIQGNIENSFVGLNLSLQGHIEKKEKKDGSSYYIFIIEKYSLISPNERKQAIAYLSSNAFKGIGPSIATKIVDTLGVDAIDKIERTPEVLLQVKGVSKNKLNSIVETIKETQILRQLCNSFKQYDIPVRILEDIYKKQKENSINYIIKNPFILVNEYHLPFDKVDILALKCGIGPYAKERLKSSLIAYLEIDFLTKGNIYLPFKEIIKGAKTLLEKSRGEIIEENMLLTTLIELNNAKSIIMEKTEETYLLSNFRKENYIAKKIFNINQQKVKEFTLDVDLWIQEMEKENDFSYAEEQKQAIKCSTINKVCIVTGGPGTGKTTVINGIIATEKRINYSSKILLCSPTGKAAKRMEEATKHKASTMHRLLKFNPKTKDFTFNENNPLDADLIIIDESSMIDMDLFYNFVKAISNKTKLVIVGDIDQLPSVGGGNILKDLINSNVITTVRLKAVFRQGKESLIITNSQSINQGITELSFGDDFEFIEINDDKEICKNVINQYIKYFNKTKDLDSVQILTPCKKNKSKNKQLYNNTTVFNSIIQKKIIPEKTQYLKNYQNIYKIGDKVMQISNNYDKNVFNGDCGRVNKIYDNKLVIDFEGQLVEYTKGELNQIVLSYAITIHKSQGSECPVVIIPITMEHKMLLTRNILYTGITRGKVKVILVGQRDALNYCINNISQNIRYSNLDKKLIQFKKEVA